VRRILRIERQIRHYRPTFRPPPPPPAKPPDADRVLQGLAMTYSQGEPLGLRQIVAATKVPQRIASAVRKWARLHGLWPYADGLGGFQASIKARRARERKGGAQ
jgi:hypothetical protein